MIRKKQHYVMIRQLLGKINEINICDDANYDEVIGACVRVIADDSNEGKEAELLIKMSKLDTNKVWEKAKISKACMDHYSLPHPQSLP
jgi:hypothetical protein